MAQSYEQGRARATAYYQAHKEEYRARGAARRAALKETHDPEAHTRSSLPPCRPTV